MYEVTCFHCGHVAHISPDIERCAVCGADLRHLITPDYASRYFYERAAELAAAGEVTLALLEVERGLGYHPTSELYLLAAILAQRLGDQTQVRRFVSAIAVDDVLRPEAEWLLRAQQEPPRSVADTRRAAATATRRQSVSPAWPSEPASLPVNTPPPVAVRANPLLYGAVALVLVLLVVWVAVEPLALMVQQMLDRTDDQAQVTPTPPAAPVTTGVDRATGDQAETPGVLLPTATPTPIQPPGVAQPALVEPIADSTAPGSLGGSRYDLKNLLANSNRPDLAALTVTASLEGDVLRLQGIVPRFDQRAAIIEQARRIPNVSEVIDVDLRISRPLTYTVEEGDSLWMISYKLYGEDRVAELFAANRESLPSAASLRVGQVLNVPQ